MFGKIEVTIFRKIDFPCKLCFGVDETLLLSKFGAVVVIVDRVS